MRFQLIVTLLLISATATADGVATPETLGEIGARLGRETEEAYSASPYAVLSSDYFARFTDSGEEPQPGHVEVGPECVFGTEAHPMLDLAYGYLQEFLGRYESGVSSARQPERGGSGEYECATGQSLVLSVDETLRPGEVILSIASGRITIAGPRAEDVRDGIILLADMVAVQGTRFVKAGRYAVEARIPLRLGSIPKNGSLKDLIFLGYNALFSGGGALYALSSSEAIPELKVRQQPGLLDLQREARADAHRHGLKTFAFLDARQKFPKDDPIFQAHPEIRGALTWKADGEYTLCTSHPLVQQWLRESVQALFRSDPELDGITIINGGEGFYHCYMRPFGVEKGETNCERCAPLGAERAVADLCNLLAAAVREVSPEAEVIVWPYSAAHVWSADPNQEAFIKLLNPGVALLTEVEKDEVLEKPEGVKKALWDYSIDMIEPGPRAKAQLAACKDVGINCYLKSEPEIGFEAPRLPHIPCMDRWLARAEAIAASGAGGAFIFPAFRPNYGTTAAEVAKLAWWDFEEDNAAPPHLVPREKRLEKFAQARFGAEAAPLIREAWREVSEAIPWSPELPSYYQGPYYLGPAHPMFADPDAAVPQVFYGKYLFMAEITDNEGVKDRPTYVQSPTGKVEVFGRYYRKMETHLKRASELMNEAEARVPARCRLLFDAENSPVQWFYRTARTEANFYESCQLRDALLELVERKQGGALSEAEREEAKAQLSRWEAVLQDELQNVRQALPLVEDDMRLDFYYGSDHTFPHAAEMIRTKWPMLEAEISEFLPGIARELGLDPEEIFSPGPQVAGVEHFKVYHEPGRFGGWPANHGMWNWGDEILVGYSKGWHKDLGPARHNIDREKPEELWFARSLDGGETWAHEHPAEKGQMIPYGKSLHGTASPGQATPELMECPGGIDFTHPDFALTFRMSDIHKGESRFYHTQDRGRNWEGPFRLPDFGAPGTAARTDYIVDGKYELTAMITVSKENGREGRPICIRTKDGGKTWEKVGEVGESPVGYAIMPSTVRVDERTLYTTVRRRDIEPSWISAWRSEDNGATWRQASNPVEDTGEGNPPALLKLRDGRLCLVYGVRKPPFRICVKMSEDNGQGWGAEHVLRSDGGNRDVGYCRAIERPDGKVVATYYFNDKATGPERYIGATIFSPEEIPADQGAVVAGGAGSSGAAGGAG